VSAHGSTASASTPALPAKQPAAKGRAEIAWVSSKTDGDILAIGLPRLQIGEASPLGRLALRVRAGLVAAEDAGWVRLWDLASGEIVREFDPSSKFKYEHHVSFALSPDASVLAIGSATETQVYRRPFDHVEFTIPCPSVATFSHDSSLLACRGKHAEVWSARDGKRVAAGPDQGGGLAAYPKALAFSSDDRSVYWTTDHDIKRWDFASAGNVASVYQSANEISHAVFPDDTSRVFISTKLPGTYKFASFIVDLKTGQTSNNSDRQSSALSHDGALIAENAADKVFVLDAATNKVVWSEKEPALIQNIAFANDADTIVFSEGNHLHVVDIPSGPRSYPPPARFVGWAGEGAAGIQHDGKTEQLSLGDRTWHPVNTAALASTVPAGTPAWAKWIAGDGSIAAEPSARHDVRPDARDTTDCPARLRVWSRKGGEKSFSIACHSTADETDLAPGWEIGGGRVVGVTRQNATLFDAASGKKLGSLAVEPAQINKPEFAHELWSMALSAGALALVSRGERLPATGSDVDPREDAMHAAGVSDHQQCESDLRTSECQIEYQLAVYSLSNGAPALAYRAPLDESRGDGEPTALVASGAFAFDHAGKHVIVGTNDGTIVVASTKDASRLAFEHFHHAPIVRIVVSPGDGWVFSEDSSGEQRIWKLPP
jgi:WD40 repeat protein